MIWYKYLYVSEDIAHRKTKIIWKIRHNARQTNLFVISLASNPENLLEIISSAELLHKAYPKEGLFIVGLAKGYEDALELALRVIMEAYGKTGNFNVRDYLLRLHSTDNAGKIICP